MIYFFSCHGEGGKCGVVVRMSGSNQGDLDTGSPSSMKLTGQSYARHSWVWPASQVYCDKNEKKGWKGKDVWSPELLGRNRINAQSRIDPNLPATGNSKLPHTLKFHKDKSAWSKSNSRYSKIFNENALGMFLCVMCVVWNRNRRDNCVTVLKWMHSLFGTNQCTISEPAM